MKVNDEKSKRYVRTYKCTDDLYTRAQKKAKSENTNLAKRVEEFLKTYILK